MSWYQFRDEGQTNLGPNLYMLIEIAHKAFIAHTDWSIRHRDTSVRQLAVLIAAELIVLKFHKDIPRGLNLAPWILFSFGFLSFVLCLAGVQSVGRAYLASMENVLFMNKLMWAINPSGKINLPLEFSHAPDPPASEDESLFVHRYRKDSGGIKNSKAFLKKTVGSSSLSLGPRSSTFFGLKYLFIQWV